MKPLNLICKLLEKCTYQSDNENEETGVTAVMLYRDCSICQRCGLERLVSRRYRNNGSRTWGSCGSCDNGSSCGGHCRNRGRPRKSHPYKVPVGVCVWRPLQKSWKTSQESPLQSPCRRLRLAAIAEIVEDLARVTLTKSLSASAPICVLLLEVIRLMTSLGMVGMSDDWKLVPLSVPASYGSRSMITVSFHLPSLSQ